MDNNSGSLVLNDALTSVNNLLNSNQRVIGVNFDANYEVQTKRVRISNFIYNAGTASAVGGIPDASSVTISIGLSPNMSTPNQKNFGVPYAAIYIGTSANAGSQVYPRYGTGIANNKFNIHSGFDYHNWNGTNSVFRINMENNSGGSVNIFAVANWKVIGYGRGTDSPV